MQLLSQGLRTTIYKVPHLEAAKNWYAAAFGVTAYFDQPFYVGFNIGGYELGLLPDENDTHLIKTENILSYWAVEDIVDAYDKMISHGAKELETPNHVGDEIKVALVKDPWQNVIGLIENPHFRPEKPNARVIEWVPFTIKPEVPFTEIEAASKTMECEFLRMQPGFIRRELLRKNEQHWVDLIYWSSEPEALAALESARQHDSVRRFLKLIELLPSDSDTPFYEIITH